MVYASRPLTSEPNKKNWNRFRSHYGTSPGVCAILWNDIKPVLPGYLQFTHLLWALMFLKVYASESVLASKIGVVEDTYRDKIWPIVKAIASLKQKVVSELCFWF